MFAIKKNEWDLKKFRNWGFQKCLLKYLEQKLKFVVKKAPKYSFGNLNFLPKMLAPWPFKLLASEALYIAGIANITKPLQILYQIKNRVLG